MLQLFYSQFAVNMFRFRISAKMLHFRCVFITSPQQLAAVDLSADVHAGVGLGRERCADAVDAVGRGGDSCWDNIVAYTALA